MLDIRLFREQPEKVATALARMGVSKEEVETIRTLDAKVRSLKTEVEQKRHELNAASKALGRMSPEEREQKRAELRQLGDAIEALDAQREELERVV